jgi:hypothetical protein
MDKVNTKTHSISIVGRRSELNLFNSTPKRQSFCQITFSYEVQSNLFFIQITSAAMRFALINLARDNIEIRKSGNSERCCYADMLACAKD